MAAPPVGFRVYDGCVEAGLAVPPIEDHGVAAADFGT